MANGSGEKRDKAPGGKHLAEQEFPTGPADMSRREAADYIAGMLDGLHEIAFRAELSFIAYLLAMDIEEAQAEKSREDEPLNPPAR